MIGLIVQARTNSTRFPSKIMAKLGDKTVIEHVMARCKAANNPELRVLAIPKGDPNEAKLRKMSVRYGFEVYAPDGDPDDVLGRFYKTACQYHMDIITRITGDCPLIDPAIIDMAVANYGISRNSIEYLTNTMLRSHPRGMDVEVFSFNALKEAYFGVTEELSALQADDKFGLRVLRYDQEHVTPFIRRYPKRFPHNDMPHPHMRDREVSKLRLCVDYPEDLELLNVIHDACKKQVHWEDRPSNFPQIAPEGAPFNPEDNFPVGSYPMYGLLNILAEFEKNPQWKNINGKYRQAG